MGIGPWSVILGSWGFGVVDSLVAAGKFIEIPKQPWSI